MKNTTYIKLDVYGDNSVRGWWWYAGCPKIEKYVVVEARRITTSRSIEESAWLVKMGAKVVHTFETSNTDG